MYLVVNHAGYNKFSRRVNDFYTLGDFSDSAFNDFLDPVVLNKNITFKCSPFVYDCSTVNKHINL